MSSIPISGLNLLTQISSSDYIPVVKDDSLTTFRTTFASISNWTSESVQASSSLSSISSSYSITSSRSDRSGTSINSENLLYPNTSTASFAITSSNTITASFALNVAGGTSTSVSSSWASSSIFSTSSSFASKSISSSYSLSASWAPINNSSSWASASIFSTSSSFASQSISSSHANTASYAINTPNPNVVKAFGTFYFTGSLTNPPSTLAAMFPFSGSLNFISASYRGEVDQVSNIPQGMDTGSSVPIRYNGSMRDFGSNARTWIFYMSTPMPSKNYTVIASIGAEQGKEWFMFVNYPLSARTTTAFSMSVVSDTADYDNRWPANPTEINWISLMVLHP